MDDLLGWRWPLTGQHDVYVAHKLDVDGNAFHCIASQAVAVAAYQCAGHAIVVVGGESLQRQPCERTRCLP